MAGCTPSIASQCAVTQSDASQLEEKKEEKRISIEQMEKEQTCQRDGWRGLWKWFGDQLGQINLTVTDKEESCVSLANLTAHCVHS